MPKRLLVVASVILAIVVVVSFLFLLRTRQPTNTTFSLKAAIIDQLGQEFPNPTFINNATSLLQNRGFNVSYYNQGLNVNFYKELAEDNYGIIVLRVHMALRDDHSTVDLFTDEQFQENRYTSEMEDGLLVKGEYLYDPGKFYFAVTSDFIRRLENNFPKSIIFAMGCWGLKPTIDMMADAFISKGAKACIGWNETVTVGDTDSETLNALEMIVAQNMTLGSAVTQTTAHRYQDPITHENVTTKLDIYPRPLVFSLALSDLIAEAKAAGSNILLSAREGSSVQANDATISSNAFSARQIRKAYELLVPPRYECAKLAAQEISSQACFLKLRKVFS